MNANYKSIILAISLFFALSVSISAAPGDLDLTFGNGGIVFTRDGTLGAFDYALGMAIQSDGKIVVVGEGSRGSFNWDFAVVRYNTDGSLDSSFGGSGIVITQLTGNYDGASAVAIQADGKIVVAGSRYGDAGGSSFAVVRYNPNGSLDTSFNGTGIVITSVGSSQDYAHSVAIQTDGKIIVAGGSGSNNHSDFALVRYNTDGSLDTTFNGTGKVITPAGGGAGSVAIQADGKIIAAGINTLVRYNPDGTLDTSFNGTGIVSIPIGRGKVAIQSDGKIVAAGGDFNSTDTGTSYDFAVVRLNPNGSLDTTFNGTGKITIPVGNFNSSACSVMIQTDGKIVATGAASSNNIDDDFAVVRLNPNGSLDTTFNGTGKVITQATAGHDIATGAAIQADGKIVVAGMSEGPLADFYDFVVVRYQGGSDAPAACPNPIDCADLFVRHHYLDFLSREPEEAGLNAWLGVLNGCPDMFTPPQTPSHCDRITVSAAFFQSPEFRLKGFFVFDFYRAAFDRLPEFAEISADMAAVTGQTPAEVFARKAAFTDSFARRAEFVSRYAALSDETYVAALLGRYDLDSITTPDPAAPDGEAKVSLTAAELSSRLTAGTLTRAQVLRAVADSDEVAAAEYQNAFVAMQYYGYLRRKPEEAGYQAWLRVISQDPNNIRIMINGFINSQEYRRRFGQP